MSFHGRPVVFQTDDNKMPPLEFDGFIDLGKDLSILHSLLVESLEKMNEVCTSNFNSKFTRFFFILLFVKHKCLIIIIICFDGFSGLRV